MEIYIDINRIEANPPEETVKAVAVKRSFPSLNTLYIIYGRHRAQKTFRFHLPTFLILFKIDKTIWQKRKKTMGKNMNRIDDWIESRLMNAKENKGIRMIQ